MELELDDEVTQPEGSAPFDASRSSPLSSMRRRRRDPSEMEAAFEGGLTPRSRQEAEATIRVGANFQAHVPPMQRRLALPAEDARVGTLAWNPAAITEAGLAQYLEKAASIRHPALFPADAACNLLHQHQYAPEPAVDALSAGGDGAGVVDSMAFDRWPEEDVANFEEGVARFGKNFHKVAKAMGGKYPVGTLILFYYARWKKTSGFRVWQTLREKEEDENIAECRQCGKGERDANTNMDEDEDAGDDIDGGGGGGGGGSSEHDSGSGGGGTDAEGGGRRRGSGRMELLRCEGCPAVYHAECCRAMCARNAAFAHAPAH
jgi:uncharacterized membrane protein YgcG